MEPLKLTPKMTILLEDGQPKEINFLSDLPHLTTGLLEVNLIRIKAQTSREGAELRTYVYDETIQVELVYLYFLRNCERCGYFSPEVLDILNEIFPTLVKIAVLHNIERGDIVNKGYEQVYKEKLEAVLFIKDKLFPLEREWKNHISNMWDMFYKHVNNELTEFMNAPLPAYFQQSEGLPEYVQKLLEVDTNTSIGIGDTQRVLSIRNSTYRIRSSYRGATMLLDGLLHITDQEDGRSRIDWYEWYEENLTPFIEPAIA